MSEDLTLESLERIMKDIWGTAVLRPTRIHVDNGWIQCIVSSGRNRKERKARKLYWKVEMPGLHSRAIP